MKRLSSGENNIVGAYVDDVLVALGSSDQMDIARRNAAKLALHELPNFMPTNITEVCDKKRWSNPIFRFELLYHEYWRIIYACARAYACFELFDVKPISFEGVYYTDTNTQINLRVLVSARVVSLTFVSWTKIN